MQASSRMQKLTKRREPARVEAIIRSMTPREIQEALNASRKKRIAAGSGTTVQEVNRLLKQFEQSRQLILREWAGNWAKASSASDAGKCFPILHQTTKSPTAGYCPDWIFNKDFLFNLEELVVLKIRLRRMGVKKAPFYRIVVADSRAPRDGAFVEEIGYYNPLRNPNRSLLTATRQSVNSRTVRSPRKPFAVCSKSTARYRH